jgi:hypothetical protein
MLVSDEINRRYVSQAAQFELVDTPKKMTPGTFEWRVREGVEASVKKSSIANWQ